MNYYNCYNEDYLYHYGVKGMKWGVRRKSQEVLDARSAYKSAKKDYNRAYNDAHNKAVAAYSPFKKHRQANNARWENAYNKAEALNKAKSNYKQAKADDKAKQKASVMAQDKEIREARKVQKDSVSEIKKNVKDYALATLSGDKKTKIAATRSISKLSNDYMSSDKVARMATSGEKKVGAAMMAAGIGMMTAVAIADRYR